MTPTDKVKDFSQSTTSSSTQRKDSNNIQTKDMDTVNKSNSSSKSRKQQNVIINSLRKRVNAGKISSPSMDERTKQEIRMRRKNRHLVEQHYKIDQENHVLLPGVPKYDEDLTRDVHDFFNLICLVSFCS